MRRYMQSYTNKCVYPCVGSSLFCLFLISYFLYATDFLSYFGLWKPPPLPIDSTKMLDGSWSTPVHIHIHQGCNMRDDYELSAKTETPLAANQNKENTALYVFNGVPSTNTLMSRTWEIFEDKPCVVKSESAHADGTTCVISHQKNSALSLLKSSQETTCLPSLLIIGFEKCSTTELLLWLSYHPNILSK